MIVAIVLAAAGFAALLHTAPFPFLFDAIYGKITLWQMPVQPGSKVVYLTFDDGPNPTVTPRLLDLLKEKHAPATFFLIDKYINVETAPIIRRAFEEGHTVGQHSGDRWLMTRSPTALVAKLHADAALIESVSGRRPCPIFRPHGGWRSVPMMSGVGRAGYRMIGWSWMTWDWYWFRKRSADRVARQVIANAAPGKIIVLHDGHHLDPRADRSYSIEAARRIIDELRARGYEFATLCNPAQSRLFSNP